MTAESYTEWDAERHGFRRWNPRNGWQPFGTDPGDYPAPDANGVRVLNLTPGKPTKEAKDRAGTWLRNAMIALALLASVAAVVSYSAQFWLVYSFKHSTVVAALQAGIPDAGALVFGALGISLALQGRRAIRPRALNVLCVAISIAMNAPGSLGWLARARGLDDGPGPLRPGLGHPYRCHPGLCHRPAAAAAPTHSRRAKWQWPPPVPRGRRGNTPGALGPTGGEAK